MFQQGVTECSSRACSLTLLNFSMSYKCAPVRRNPHQLHVPCYHVRRGSVLRACCRVHSPAVILAASAASRFGLSPGPLRSVAVATR